MTSDVLIGQYPKQQVVRDRNGAALLRWAAYISAQAIPTNKPDEEWVRNRIMADRMPEQIDSYVQRTLSYFLQDPGTIENINAFLNSFNTADIEDQLSNANDAIINGFSARFGMSDVSDDQVQQWYADNGFA